MEFGNQLQLRWQGNKGLMPAAAKCLEGFIYLRSTAFDTGSFPSNDTECKYERNRAGLAFDPADLLRWQ